MEYALLKLSSHGVVSSLPRTELCFPVTLQSRPDLGSTHGNRNKRTPWEDLLLQTTFFLKQDFRGAFMINFEYLPSFFQHFQNRHSLFCL